MGKNTYNGGGTIVHAGSGFFTHKGGPGVKRRPVDGSDTPGPAKPGSICDFSSIRPKKRRKVAKSVNDKRPKLDAAAISAKKLRGKATNLINRCVGLKRQKEDQIFQLQLDLQRAKRDLEALIPLEAFARAIDLDGLHLERDASNLEAALAPLTRKVNTEKTESKKPTKPKRVKQLERTLSKL